MKSIIILIFMFIFVNLSAKESKTSELDNSWVLERTNLQYENDLVFVSDSDYTSGIKLENIYSIKDVTSPWLKMPFFYDEQNYHFASIRVSQQIFTPQDIFSKEIVVDERPYAGWLYIDFGLHESTEDELYSLNLQVGIVGPGSLAEESQKTVHGTLNLKIPQGWDNQLKNELGINLILQHKWRLVPEPLYGIESNFMPFVEVSAGNVKTYARVGALMRFGINPANDFGSSSIDVGGESGIPTSAGSLLTEGKDWSFSVNLGLALTVVAHDIFLDGNTFNSSHSIEKEPFVVYASYGLSVRYKHVAIEYILTDTTKEFKLQPRSHEYGSLLFSYIF
ncbi:MAG: lipid A deacylase LpxR family protein [Sulfurimonas sp.]